jgi:hypothetical protein
VSLKPCSPGRGWLWAGPWIGFRSFTSTCRINYTGFKTSPPVPLWTDMESDLLTPVDPCA